MKPASYYVKRRKPSASNMIWFTQNIFLTREAAEEELAKGQEKGWEYAIFHMGEVIARRSV